ncbi:MAG: hypothetical protein C4315_12675 [Chloroflexota bacterium]
MVGKRSWGVHWVLLFVTDDFRGLREVIAKLFPCLLCRAKLAPQSFKEARDILRRIRHARDKGEGRLVGGEAWDGPGDGG